MKKTDVFWTSGVIGVVVGCFLVVMTLLWGHYYMRSNVYELTSKNFEKFLQLRSYKILVICFYTHTCPACTAQMEILEALASKMDKDVMIAKCNVYTSGINWIPLRIVPTFYIFSQNGVKSLKGYQTKNKLLAIIKAQRSIPRKRGPKKSKTLDKRWGV